ncbi:MAG TPA: aminopeptidase [Symbiobacteriaceae bacterium]
MADRWAGRVLRESLGLRAGETVLIAVDSPLEGAARVLTDQALELGAARVTVCRLPDPSGPLTVVPRRWLDEMACADVVISLFSRFDLSREMPLIRAAMAVFRRQNRSRWALGAGVDEGLLTEALAGDPGIVATAARSLWARLRSSAGVRITTEAGTDLTLKWSGRRFCVETGLIRLPGMLGNLPGGEVYIAPREESAEGRLVVDLSLGDIPLDRPVVLTFHRGRVVSLEGGEAARELRRRLGSDPWAWTVGEFGVGANPYLPVRGVASTDEKVRGTVHVALGGNLRFGGKNPADSHYDCVISRPRVHLQTDDGIAPLMLDLYKN